ncbi:cytochrome c oxidase accessory protein FixG [Solimonas aquatica]|uniref:Cytochrome c oxidase accessory protein FixG n=1 Tax=Solimonas aquatica TaxID=489703 RepID=A0A1H8ZMG4_9GAMM|nr:cytochrome c oxidase accessory protein CcoG [Solimonas aquatica]SEP65471.1 cytochrome c oxidase accessory protein FixG [Solimonas aquatica]
MQAHPDPKPSSEAQGEVFLYEKPVKIQSRRSTGRYSSLRLAAMLALLGIYYLLPWFTWNGEPLVFLDLPHRRFHVLTMTLVPQDLILLTGILLAAALTLFFFTTLAGRLWCGYACPQTVWTEAFIWFEHLIEGDRHQRLKLDKSPWNTEKVLRKGGKHFAWVAFSLLTGFTFVAYFVPARELFGDLLHGQLSGWPAFWSLFYGFATWGNAGFMREQVCKYMCPYARFQSAMFDRDTLIIAYDEKRGEPRKTLAKKVGQPAGDCVDCSLCVQVCPVGIDIRKGLQYECIACAACVDACNNVMDSVGKPRGLVHYTSSNHDAGKPYHILRPRAIGYGLVWLAVLVGVATLILTHSPLRFDVLRDRHALYRELVDGSLENVYVLKITNEDERPHHFKVDGQFQNGPVATIVPNEFDVPPGATVAKTVSVRLPAASEDEHERAEHAVATLQLNLTATDAPQLKRSRTARFLTGDPHENKH